MQNTKCQSPVWESDVSSFRIVPWATGRGCTCSHSWEFATSSNSFCEIFVNESLHYWLAVSLVYFFSYSWCSKLSVQWLDICVLDSVIPLRSLAPAWHHAAVTGSLTVLPGLSFTSLCLFRNWQSVLLNPSPFPHSAPTLLPSGNPQPVLYLWAFLFCFVFLCGISEFTFKIQKKKKVIAWKTQFFGAVHVFF